MKTKIIKTTGLACALTTFAFICATGIHAQQDSNKRNATPTSTNWIGYLVFGKEDSLDQIARGPFPITDQQVEIGLRSDGVIIWRSTSKPK
jgi:hypothetical protein